MNTLFRHAEADHAEHMSKRLAEIDELNRDDDPAVLHSFMQWWINDLAGDFKSWDAFAAAEATGYIILPSRDYLKQQLRAKKVGENIVTEKVVRAVHAAWGVEGDVSVAWHFVLAMPPHRRLWSSANPAQLLKLDQYSPLDAMKAAVESWIKCSVHNAWLVAAEEEEGKNAAAAAAALGGLLAPYGSEDGDSEEEEEAKQAEAAAAAAKAAAQADAVARIEWLSKNSRFRPDR